MLSVALSRAIFMITLSETDSLRVSQEFLTNSSMFESRVKVKLMAAVTHLAVATDALARLSALGIRISLDDFGTGNSPLRLLHDLPVDEVKIDCSFTTPMAHDATARTIVHRLVALGHDLGTVVVAEGVQDQIVHGLLVATGCDHAQGFHYAYPADGAATSRWLDHHLSNTGARS